MRSPLNAYAYDDNKYIEMMLDLQVFRKTVIRFVNNNEPKFQMVHALSAQAYSYSDINTMSKCQDDNFNTKEIKINKIARSKEATHTHIKNSA